MTLPGHNDLVVRVPDDLFGPSGLAITKSTCDGSRKKLIALELKLSTASLEGKSADSEQGNRTSLVTIARTTRSSVSEIFGLASGHIANAYRRVSSDESETQQFAVKNYVSRHNPKVGIVLVASKNQRRRHFFAKCTTRKTRFDECTLTVISNKKLQIDIHGVPYSDYETWSRQIEFYSSRFDGFVLGEAEKVELSRDARKLVPVVLKNGFTRQVVRLAVPIGLIPDDYIPDYLSSKEAFRNLAIGLNFALTLKTFEGADGESQENVNVVLSVTDPGIIRRGFDETDQKLRVPYSGKSFVGSGKFVNGLRYFQELPRRKNQQIESAAYYRKDESSPFLDVVILCPIVSTENECLGYLETENGLFVKFDIDRSRLKSWASYATQIRRLSEKLVRNERFP